MKVKNGSLEISSLEKTDSGSYICEAKLLFYTISTTMTLKVEVLQIQGQETQATGEPRPPDPCWIWQEGEPCP